MSYPNSAPQASPRDPFAEGPGRYAASVPGSSKKQVEGWIDTLFRRRWLIIGCLVLAGVVAGFLAVTQQPVYQSSAVVLVDLSRVPGSNQGGEFVGAAPFIRSDRTIATELYVIQNSGAIHRSVNARLQQMASEGGDISYPASGTVQFALAGRTVGSAIQVTAVSPDPREAAVLANLYAEEYVRQTQDASRSYLVSTRSFLEEQEEVRRQELREAEDAYEDYLRRTGAVRMTQESGALIGRLASIEAQRDQALLDLRTQEARLAQVDQQIDTISPRLASLVASGLPRQMDVLRAEIARLQEERQTRIAYLAGQANRTSAQADPRVQEYDRRIAQAEQDLQQLAAQYAQESMAVGGVSPNEGAVSSAAGLVQQSIQARIDIDGLRSRVTQIEQQRRQIEGNLGAVPELSTELGRLERSRAYAEQMYQAVVQRLQDTRIQEAAEPGYARILRQAGVPDVPTGDGPWKGLGIGLLLGLIAGIVLAVLRDRLDTRIYKPEQLRTQGFGVVGVIPNLAPQIKETHQGASHAEREGERISTSLVTLLDPFSSPSEAYRHLRTSVQFSRMDQVVGTVLVTSSAAGEGKSTTAANLAIAMAQAQRRTLLVDADLRRPNQHQIFGISDEHGLATILQGGVGAGHAGLDQGEIRTWLQAFRSKQHPDLYVLPAGVAGMLPAASVRPGEPTNPAELFGSRRMRELLEFFREEFDVVVLDTPPVLAATDAVLLSTQADATLVVVRAGNTKEGDLEHGMEMLHDVGARVAGVLLNGFDLSMAYGYRYSYGHYTKYGPYSRYGYGEGSDRASKRTSLPAS